MTIQDSDLSQLLKTSRVRRRSPFLVPLLQLLPTAHANPGEPPTKTLASPLNGHQNKPLLLGLWNIEQIGSWIRLTAVAPRSYWTLSLVHPPQLPGAHGANVQLTGWLLSASLVNYGILVLDINC